MSRVQFLGLACLVGGFLFAVLNSAELVGMAEAPAGLLLVIGVVLLLGLFGGPLGLLALRAGGSGGTGRVGAIISLLGLVSYLYGQVVTVFIPDLGVFYLLGALLSGLGMFIFGLAAIPARQLEGWRRFAPLLVGLYYVVMIPIQIVFFIIPNERPNELLLACWGLTWAVLGYAIYSSSRQKHAEAPTVVYESS